MPQSSNLCSAVTGWEPEVRACGTDGLKYLKVGTAVFSPFPAVSGCLYTFLLFQAILINRFKQPNEIGF